MIEVRGVAKAFGDVHAVRDVSFTAKDGEVTAILGPNGAGKTTTLRMVSTLVRPDRGEVLVDGAVREPAAMRAMLGAVGHAVGLYPRLTAKEHVEYFAALQGLTAAACAQRAEALFRALDMEEIKDRRTAGFSQGEKLKVAIARALVHDPKHVLLDEPTNGLDVMSTRAVRDIVRRFRDQGKCVLLSSHVMQEVAALCDRIVIIAKGVVLADGTALELQALTHKNDLEEAFVAIVGGAAAGHA
jgi:sodium transport system ATP-binding protein